MAELSFRLPIKFRRSTASAAAPRAAASGFTLLELILSLALAVVLVGLVTMALQTFTRASDAGRRDVRQAMLARSLLQRIADDLRATIRYAPPDISTTAALAGLAPLGEDFDLDNAEPEDTTDDAAPTQLVSDTIAPAEEPGLVGDQFAVQVDLSRLPRLDEYALLVDAGDAAAPPGDIQSVAWYLRTEPRLANVANSVGRDPTRRDLDGLDLGNGPGLVRRALDRAATVYASENGLQENLDSREELLAGEVVALEFRYFDGSDWRTEWDSAEEEALPLAVEVGLALRSDDGAAADEGTASRAAAGRLSNTTAGTSIATLVDDDTVDIYRLVVHLPMALPLDESESSGETAESETASDPAAGETP